MTLDPQVEYFDLYQIFVNEIIGDVWLSIIIFLAVILIMSIKFKMPFEVSIMFGLLIIAAMFSQTMIMLLWVLLVLFVGVLFYWTLSKALQQGG